jgi:hypothetical protein
MFCVSRPSTAPGTYASATEPGRSPPGKDADGILLDATALNVALLHNVPGAVVSLMDGTNVETVIVVGAVRNGKGQLLDLRIASVEDAVGDRDLVLEDAADQFLGVVDLLHRGVDLGQ